MAATDQDSDTLTYTLAGDDDDGLFDINWATGQIMTKSPLNLEVGLTDRDNNADGTQLQVTVRATDPAGVPDVGTAVEADSDEVTVYITVTDVNEAPTITGSGTDVSELTFDEVDGVITTALDNYTAADEDEGDDAPTEFTLAGDDGSKFDITGGALTFKAKPDYEMPTDDDGDNAY